MRRRVGIVCVLLPLLAGACAAPGAPRAFPDAPPDWTAVEERFVPALEALQAAVEARDDALARAVHERLMLLGPTGAALDLARGFERILDGRAAVRGLEARLECHWLPGADPAEGHCVLRLAAFAKDGVARTLEPGPATVRLRTATVDASGGLGQGEASSALPALARLDVPAEGRVAVDLARVPLRLAPNALAIRLSADVDLRSGTVRVDGATLPAMHVAVTPGEVVLLHGRLLALGAADPGDLVRLAARAGAGSRELLELALRLRREDREAALDALAAAALPEALVQPLAPALRWLAPGYQAGADARAWAAWLDRRALRNAADRGRSEPRLPGPETGRAGARHLDPRRADRTIPA